MSRRPWRQPCWSWTRRQRPRKTCCPDTSDGSGTTCHLVRTCRWPDGRPWSQLLSRCYRPRTRCYCWRRSRPRYPSARFWLRRATDGISSGFVPCPAGVAGRWPAAVAAGVVGASANSPSEVRRAADCCDGGGGGYEIGVRYCDRCFRRRFHRRRPNVRPRRHHRCSLADFPPSRDYVEMSSRTDPCLRLRLKTDSTKSWSVSTVSENFPATKSIQNCLLPICISSLLYCLLQQIGRVWRITRAVYIIHKTTKSFKKFNLRKKKYFQKLSRGV